MGLFKKLISPNSVTPPPGGGGCNSHTDTRCVTACQGGGRKRATYQYDCDGKLIGVVTDRGCPC